MTSIVELGEDRVEFRSTFFRAIARMPSSCFVRIMFGDDSGTMDRVTCILHSRESAHTGKSGKATPDESRVELVDNFYV